MPEAMSLCDAAPSSYTESAIFQHADSFTALLVQLSALEHATTAIEELSERLAALEVRLASRETLLHALSREISCRRRKVEELSPGSARSAMLLASKGKQAFAQKLAARESRLQEAMIRLRDEERTVALLQHEIASVSKQLHQHRKIHQTSIKHGQDIEQLYERIFGGPTPEYPEEDEAENAVFSLEKRCKEERLQLHSMASTVERLAEAIVHASHAVRALETARLSRHQSSVMPKPSCSIHRASARRAIMHCESVSSLFKQIQEDDPAISFYLHLPPLEGIFQQSTDNSPAAMWQAGDQLYRRITAASQVMQHAARALSHQQMEASSRLAMQEKRLYRTESKLRAARQQLQTIRRTIFIDTLRSRSWLGQKEIYQGTNGLPLPICDADEGYFSSSPRSECTATLTDGQDHRDVLPAYSPVSV